MGECYRWAFYLSCIVGLAGLCLTAYVVVQAGLLEQPHGEEEGRTDTRAPTEEGGGGSPALPQREGRLLKPDSLRSSTRCNISAKAVRRGNTLCYAMSNGEEFMCLDDIVRHQTGLLSSHGALPYVCTTMFGLHSPADLVPCICSVKFPETAGFYTLVQPRVQSMSEATEVAVLNDAESRLPRSLKIANRYEAPYTVTALFEGDQVPHVAQALLAVGIDIYQHP